MTLESRDNATSCTDSQIPSSVLKRSMPASYQDQTGLEILIPHTQSISAIAYSPDGELVATGSSLDGTIKIWELKSGKPLRTLRGHIGTIKKLIFSSDGGYVASIGWGGIVKISHVKSGQERYRLDEEDTFGFDASFTEDGNWLILSVFESKKTEVGLRLSSGQDNMLLNEKELEDISTEEINPGACCVELHGDSIAFRDKSGGKYYKIQNILNPLTGELGDNSFPAIADLSLGEHLFLSHDNQFLAQRNKNQISVWNLKSGRKLNDLPPSISGGHITFSEDAKFLAEDIGDQIKIWEIMTGEMKKILKQPFGNDGRGLWGLSLNNRIVGFTGSNGAVEFWDWVSDLRLFSFGQQNRQFYEGTLEGPLANFSLAKDGGWVAIKRFKNSDESLTLELVKMGSSDPPIPILLTNRDDEVIDTIIFSPDGRWIGYGPHKKSLHLNRIPDVEYNSSYIDLKEAQYYYDISYDGQWIVSAGRHQVNVWSLESGQREYSFIPSEVLGSGVSERWVRDMGVTAVAISQEGKWIAIGNGDSISVYEADKKLFLQIPSRRVSALAFSPDGRWLGAGFGLLDKVAVYDLHGRGKTCFVSNSPQSGFRFSFNAAAYHGYGKLGDGNSSLRFSPDGQRLINGNENGTVSVWEVPSGHKLYTLWAHEGVVENIDFGFQGSWFATGGTDGKFSVWDIDTGRNLVNLLLNKRDDSWLAYTPEGFFDDFGGGWKSLFFRLPKDSLQMFDSEQLLQTYYQPGIWRDVLNSGKPISELLENRNDPRLNVSRKGFEHLTPPEIRIRSPLNGSVVFERQINFEFEPKDDGSGLQDCRIFHNQSLVRVLRGNLSTYADFGSKVFTVPVKLIPNENELTAYCFNEANVKSKNVSVTFDFADYETLSVNSSQGDDVVFSVYDELAFSPNGQWLVAFMGKEGILNLWKVEEKRLVRTLANHVKNKNGLQISFSPDGRWLAGNIEYGGVQIWDVETGLLSHTLTDFSERVSSYSFSPQSDVLVTIEDDFNVTFWDVVKGTKRKSFLLDTKDEHMIPKTIVLRSDGLFVAAREGATEVHFWDGGMPPSKVPFVIERSGARGDLLQISQDGRWAARYYVPTSIFGGRIASGASGSTGLTIYDLTRQEVAHDIVLPYEIRWVEFSQNGKWIIVRMENGFQRVIETSTGDSVGTIRDMTGASATAVSSNGERAATIIYDGSIRVWKLKAESVKSPFKRKAYVIGIGVNDYNSPHLNLKFANADAQTFVQDVSSSLKNFNIHFDLVVPVLLTDEFATKANILRLFSRLSGNQVSFPKDSPASLHDISPARPGDLVIIFFAGHGAAKGDRYYLIPYNTDLSEYGDPKKGEASRNFASFGLSDRELEESFERIQASDLVLIIDACESGQALEAQEPRRGPLNSRGLAQLAYEKGMYILAASQAYESAVELEKLGHGLLTSVLVREGLNKKMADFSPKDGLMTAQEWFDFAIQQVPKAYEIAQNRKLLAAGRPIIFDVSNEPIRSQVPTAYYRREVTRNPLVIAFAIDKE